MSRKRTQPTATTPESVPEPAPAPVETLDPADERLVTRAQRAVGVGLAAIEGALAAATKALGDLVVAGKYTEATSKAASHVAWLTQRAAQIMGELRKGEVHDQAQLRKLTPAIVLEWYRQLDDEERADFARRMDRIDAQLARGT